MAQNKISRRSFLRGAGASATIAAASCMAPSAAACDIKSLWSMDLQILATSDTHGKFDPWDYAANKADASGSVAQQATAIKQCRTRNTLVVDAGNRVLHAGYDILPDGTVRSRNRGLPVSAGGWHGMNRTSYNVTAVSPMCFLVRRNAFVPMAEGNSLAVDLAQWCMARMQDGMRHVYTPHCVVKADAESAFEGFRVKVPAGWYDPCATGSKRA